MTAKLTKRGAANTGRSTTRRCAVKWIATLCLLVVTLVSTSYLYWVYVNHRFLTVVENNVFRTAEMPPDELVEFVGKHHVRTVIDFRTTFDRVHAEERALTSNGIRSISIPSDLVPSDEAVDSFLDAMGDVSNYPILFHCEHGIGRSSLFEAIYRIEFLGWSNEAARKSALLRSLMGSFEVDDVRGQYILIYEAQNRRSLQAAVTATLNRATH
jgi:predicted protein tyrosine phosphatase